MPSEESKEESKTGEKPNKVYRRMSTTGESLSVMLFSFSVVSPPSQILANPAAICTRPHDAGAPVLIDATVVRLIDWGTSGEFEEVLSAWMKDHCEDFGGSLDLAEEQPLSLGTIFSDYCEWLDGKLGNFCDEENLDPDDVSKKMAECLASNKEDEFFPAFMAITEYDEFARQMHDLAVARMRMDKADDAVEAANEDGGFNISGTWEADPDAYNPEGAEEALILVACPWVFRKVLKRASKFVKDITIKQTDKEVEFAFTIHLVSSFWPLRSVFLNTSHFSPA
jgi:hypothetical protein